MNTRSNLPTTELRQLLCVYCGNAANTNDHAPPRCLLRAPLPSNLLTLPACSKCNNEFSFDENVVRAFLTMVSSNPELAPEKEPGGWLERTCLRNHKLSQILQKSRQSDGTYQFTQHLVKSFDRVFRKTVQGVFYGLYHRLVPATSLQLIRIEDRRTISPEDVVTQLRPNPLLDITDEPLSEISPKSWHSREPFFILQLQRVSQEAPLRRVFRLKRDTPPEWIHFQDDVFRFTFVKCEGGNGGACVFELWKTLIVTVAAPWPDGRGPLRRGRKNAYSRE